MSNWVKFSDRLPSGADANSEGELFMQHEDGTRSITCTEFTEEEPDQCVEDYAGWFWLENVPPLSKPRTLEDVVREYVDTSKPQRVLDLFKEMKEFIGVSNE